MPHLKHIIIILYYTFGGILSIYTARSVNISAFINLDHLKNKANFFFDWYFRKSIPSFFFFFFVIGSRFHLC